MEEMFTRTADPPAKGAAELPAMLHRGTEVSGHTLQPEQSMDNREAQPSEPGDFCSFLSVFKSIPKYLACQKRPQQERCVMQKHPFQTLPCHA